MNELDDLLINSIERHASQAVVEDVWNSGRFAKIKMLSVDIRGQLGEEFLAEILRQLGCSVEHPKGTDINAQQWDLRVNNKTTLEVKTATVGKNGNNFQHENIYIKRDFDFLVLVDITPNEIYLTPAPKSTLPFSVPNNIWTVRSKKMHLRENGVQYKWDLTLNDVRPRQIRALDDAERLLQNIIRDIK